MKLLSYSDNGVTLPGLLVDKFVYSLSPLCQSILDLIDKNNTSLSFVDQAFADGNLPQVGRFEELHIKPPLQPRKLLSVAGNFVAHIEEGGGKLEPEHTQAPWIFCVPPTQLMVGHKEEIRLIAESRQIDYEGELAIVIGRKAKRVSATQASEYIAGYTIYNDVSERKPYMIEHVDQPRQLSFWYTKSFDTFGPTGPYITTADEIADPQDLTIRVEVSGEERQNCSTQQMIFTVYQLIEFLTKFLTLEPGDIITTGTPAGVGSATGKFLKGGDIVRIHIDHLGTLENPVIQT